MIARRYIWDKLHALVCPTAVLGPIISVRQCKQTTYDTSGQDQEITLPLKEFYACFMHCCQLLYESPTPAIPYAMFLIRILAPTLRQKVEAKFQDHIGPQVMTNKVQFEMMNRAYATALQCERDIAIPANIVQQTAVSSMTSFVHQHAGNAVSVASADVLTAAYIQLDDQPRWPRRRGSGQSSREVPRGAALPQLQAAYWPGCNQRRMSRD